MIDTDRLVLRPLDQNDWLLFESIYSSSERMQYIAEPLVGEELQQLFEGRCQPWQQQEEQWLSLVIEVKQPQLAIGMIGFKLTDVKLQRGEIGFVLDAAAQGHGYVTEAGQAFIDHLFLHFPLHKITAQCSTLNTNSFKLLERLGMQREGCLRDNSLINGKLHNDYLYGLLLSDWQQR